MNVKPLYKTQTMERAEAEQISSTWPALLILGILTSIAGVVVLSIDWTLLTLAYFVGALFIIRGIFHLFSPPLVGSSRAINIFVGALGILAGIGVLFFPGISLFVLAVFIGAWLVFWGAVNIVSSIYNRHIAHYWWLSLIAGIVAIPLGILALSQPILTLAIAITVVGIWAIVVGITEIALSFEVRNLPKMVTTEMEMKRAA